MDRLQFNRWFLDGWLISAQENVGRPGRATTITLTFEVIEGDLSNGDERIWFIPDPNAPLHHPQFQGSILSLDMQIDGQVNQIRHLDNIGSTLLQNWGPPGRTLTLQITDVVRENDWGFDPDFVSIIPLNRPSSPRPPDPDIERRLAQEQIDRECKLAREQQEQIDYKNFPNRLDSID